MKKPKPIRITPPAGQLTLTIRRVPLVTTGYGAALVDLNTGELVGAYRDAIVAALPPGVVPLESWWRVLASALIDHYTVQERAAERPPERIREAMRNIRDTIDLLGEELRGVNRLPLSSAWGDASSQLLAALVAVRNLAVYEDKRYGRMIAATSARNDPHRKILYEAVLDLWNHGLGQGLHYSKGGPLVRFFEAVVRPVLGEKTPGDSRIGKIVQTYLFELRKINRKR